MLIDDAGHRPPLSSNRDPAYTIKAPHGVMYDPRKEAVILIAHGHDNE